MALEMEDDLPAPMPPVRAFDADLLAWMDIYERALRRIAVYGDADSAMLACRVMSGDCDALGD